MTENLENKNNSSTEKTANSINQNNIYNHAKTSFTDVVIEALKTDGLNAVGFKGHGKTRFLFCIASELMKNDNVRVIAFDKNFFMYK